MKIDIITEDERRLVEKTPESGFITDFVTWASKRTDAPLFLLEAAGMMALSLSAGDTVVLPNPFGSGGVAMNLYTLIVGPSTTMRKTTVLGYVQDILPKNGQTKVDYIVRIDDTSPQALNKKCAEAGGTMTPVVFNLDEVSGLFQVARRKNSYLGGLDKILLTMYDHSAISISRTGGDVESKRGAFVNLWAASTPEPLMEILDGDDISSGLLPRFIIFDARDAVRGESIPFKERLRTNPEWEAEKEVLGEFLYDIARDRANGVPIGQNPDGSVNYFVETMNASDDALDRLYDLDEEAKRSVIDDGDAIGAIRGRATWHIYKVAGLYALSRAGRGAQVELIDILRAAHLIEETSSDLVKMVDEVGANILERRIKGVMEFLALNGQGRQKSTTIARKFSLSMNEVRELLGTLTVRGMVEVEKVNGEPYWRAV